MFEWVAITVQVGLGIVLWVIRRLGSNDDCVLWELASFVDHELYCNGIRRSGPVILYTMLSSIALRAGGRPYGGLPTSTRGVRQ